MRRWQRSSFKKPLMSLWNDLALSLVWCWVLSCTHRRCKLHHEAFSPLFGHQTRSCTIKICLTSLTAILPFLLLHGRCMRKVHWPTLGHTNQMPAMRMTSDPYSLLSPCLTRVMCIITPIPPSEALLTCTLMWVWCSNSTNWPSTWNCTMLITCL